VNTTKDLHNIPTDLYILTKPLGGDIGNKTSDDDKSYANGIIYFDDGVSFNQNKTKFQFALSIDAEN